jgi:hypothetical protein
MRYLAGSWGHCIQRIWQYAGVVNPMGATETMARLVTQDQ